MKLLFIILFLITINTYSQSINRISGRCGNTFQYSKVEVQGGGNINYVPCDTGGNIFYGLTDFSNVTTLNGLLGINGTNYNTITDFTNASYQTTNGASEFTNVGSNLTHQFRLGSPKSFLETVQRTNAGALNEIRLRTDETVPPAGGFAEFWLQSDTTHSFAYVRAQRDIYLRTDNVFMSNFFDNNKFRLFLNMDNIDSHPTEDTSMFQVGNYFDQTNFIQVSNIPGDMKTQIGGIGGVFLRNKVHIIQLQTPTTATDPCITGQIVFDANFIYTCIASNTWHRSASATW
jgi:hypothetical protein